MNKQSAIVGMIVAGLVVAGHMVGWYSISVVFGLGVALVVLSFIVKIGESQSQFIMRLSGVIAIGYALLSGANISWFG